jgi:hypothetical protein
MQTLATTTAILSLLPICYQDFSRRSVHWIYFPLLTVAGIFYSLLFTHSLSQLLTNTLCNSAFLLLQFGILKLYFVITRGSATRLLDNKIGWGDILFLLAAGFFFSPGSFILFYLLSLSFSLIFAVVMIRLKPAKYRTVPLAGLQALALSMLLLFTAYSQHPILTGDWLLNKLWGQ